MTVITREAIIEAAKAAAAKAGAPISRADFERISGISQYHIYRDFPDGGWSEVKKLAGLERHPKDNEALSDDQVMREFNRVASELGRIPTWAQFAARATISADVIRRRFGGLQGTLKHYRAWLEETRRMNRVRRSWPSSMRSRATRCHHHRRSGPMTRPCPPGRSGNDSTVPRSARRSTSVAFGMRPSTNRVWSSSSGWSVMSWALSSRRFTRPIQTVKPSVASTSVSSAGSTFESSSNTGAVTSAIMATTPQLATSSSAGSMTGPSAPWRSLSCGGSSPNWKDEVAIRRITSRCTRTAALRFGFGCAGFIGRWIRCQRPFPAAVGIGRSVKLRRYHATRVQMS